MNDKTEWKDDGNSENDRTSEKLVFHKNNKNTNKNGQNNLFRTLEISKSVAFVYKKPAVSQ